jgi:hypothetical protein
MTFDQILHKLEKKNRKCFVQKRIVKEAMKLVHDQAVNMCAEATIYVTVEQNQKAIDQVKDKL